MMARRVLQKQQKEGPLTTDYGEGEAMDKFGPKPYNMLCDIWSLGISAYVLSTG